ncbi:hypothetical protein, partial [Escherichia coli]|uniref:hypothetical protein n=1 Tax=Escherichia coli TaxID=562 RepID=UPI001BC8A031
CIYLNLMILIKIIRGFISAALFHFAFHASPLPMCDDAAKSDREQPEIDRGHNDFECRVHIFSSCD